tara:strand:- start:33 stop:470 length:438 start_codon:yes stop_codon:yes gene_type:complete
MNDNEKQILQHVINGVDLEILNYKCDYVGIQYSKANGYYFLNNKLHITYEGGSTGKSLDDCRLILRPLCDLSKKEFKDIVFPIDDYIEKNRDSNRKLSVSRVQLQSLTCQSATYYSTVEILFKNHFDIFGSIEKGSANDVNTIEN